jgi:citrate synthase
MSTASEEIYHPGLEGVIANETAISNVEGKQGAGGLEYRGYQIEDLAAGVSYLEAAYLLLHGDLPKVAELAAFQSRIKAESALPAPLLGLLRQIPPGNHPMDVLRTSVSVLAHFDPEVNASPTDHAANVRKAERMLAQMPTAVAARERIGKGLDPLAPRDDLDFSGNFLYMVHGEPPSEAMRKAFDLSLVLYAEHELNA